MNTVLIVGATGVIGEAALEHFIDRKGWDVIALSRRKPQPAAKGEFRWLPVDLTNTEACRQASVDLSPVTHVIYAAVAEKPGLIGGWADQNQMQLNLQMLSNLMEPLVEAAQNLQHVTLLQGAKAYGAHVGHIPPLPSREDKPRDEHENFYWLQEDHIRDLAASRGFFWTVFRPQIVIGAAWGAVMNPLLPLAAFGAIRREEGKPFSYPGGALQVIELADAALLAEAFEWAGTTENARNEIFNITNGDVFAWQEAWPAIAEALGMECGPDEPMALVDYLLDRADLWSRIVARENLQPLSLTSFLGESHHYADLLLRREATGLNRPGLLSTIKLRQAGFNSCRDSEASIAYWINELKRRRLIPA